MGGRRGISLLVVGTLQQYASLLAKLRDAQGKLNVAKLKQNPQFKIMIEDGWSWIIIPAEVDELFPAFAKIAQKALNTSNHVGIAVGELETQLQLSDLVDDNGFT